MTERVMPDEVPIVIETNYHNGGEEKSVHIPLEAGCEPFVLFQMKQREGVIVLDVTASLLESEDELIETLEVFFETMLFEREMRRQAEAEMLADLPEHNEQGEHRE